jgi:flavin-dependent dehydrogenase
MTRAARTCDVCVVGTGPAGAATALALARRGIHVMLLGVATHRSRSPGESLHGVAVNSLRELGLRPSSLVRHVRPSHLAQIAWESADLRERHAIDHVWGPELHLDRPAFDDWLYTEAIRAGAVPVSCDGVDDVQFARGGQRIRYSLGTARGERIESTALVDATGRSAAIMRRLGGRLVTAPDRLIAITTVYDTPLEPPSVLIEATADGWWYSAPLPGDRSVAIWFTDAASAHGRALRADYVDAALHSAEHTRARFARAKSDAARAVCAAGPSLTVYDPSLPVLPVGDAATAFDPISGDGLCFALRSALDAADTLAQFVNGRRSALEAYAAGVEAVFRRHVTRRAILYDSVTRFGEATFWKRSRASTESEARTWHLHRHPASPASGVVEPLARERTSTKPTTTTLGSSR